MVHFYTGAAGENPLVPPPPPQGNYNDYNFQNKEYSKQYIS